MKRNTIYVITNIIIMNIFPLIMPQNNLVLKKTEKTQVTLLELKLKLWKTYIKFSISPSYVWSE